MTVKQIFTRIFWVIYAVGMLFLAYALCCVHTDTKDMYARLGPFEQQCEASGNHMERHNDNRGMPRLGCYEGPKAKLIKEFE